MFRRLKGFDAPRSWRALLLLAILAIYTPLDPVLMPCCAQGQQDALIDRPISAITFTGLERTSEQLIRNNIRAAVGNPYDPVTVRSDVRRLNDLGGFKHVDVIARLEPDGTVTLIYQFQEQPIIVEVQVVDNRLISDQELRGVIPLIPGGPRDDFLIQKARRNIQELYRQRGHYLTEVTVDEPALDESGILIFRIIEGPRVRVRAIRFQGNQAFTDRQLMSQVRTRTAIPFLRKGALDEQMLADDVAAIDRYYQERGHLDSRVDRLIDLSPDDREATITFLIEDGPAYTLRSVRTRTVFGQPLKLFAREQIAAMMELKRGDVYSADKLNRSIRLINEAYGRMGYPDVSVRPFPIRDPDNPVVDVEIEIDEGRRYHVGLVNVSGHFLTRDKVIRRETRLEPGRPFDAIELRTTEDRLRATRLFGEPIRVTVLEPDPDDPEYRDVLIEVREQNTGSFNFGVAAGSDSGIFGEFILNQRNFDLFDFPESLEELIAQRAFRGAGQSFNMSFRPGNEIFEYSVSVTEPHLFDTDYSLRVGGQYFRRIFDLYDRETLSSNISLGRRLGDIWTMNGTARFSRIELSSIEPFAPTEIFQDSGPDTLTSLGLTLERRTIDRFRRPGSGSVLSLSFEQVGALGGDFDFSKAQVDYTVYFTLDEDYLGRITTLRLNSQIGYIFSGRAPVYERFYLGGRTFRGFRFRTISPKGIRADDGLPSNEPVGGDWSFFVGAQYEFPLFGEALTGVVFVDSGTVTNRPGFDDYRVSAGLGIRLAIPQFGPVPLAFDFGFPLVSQPGDRSQVLSFSAELPF